MFSEGLIQPPPDWAAVFIIPFFLSISLGAFLKTGLAVECFLIVTTSLVAVSLAGALAFSVDVFLSQELNARSPQAMIEDVIKGHPLGASEWSD